MEEAKDWLFSVSGRTTALVGKILIGRIITIVSTCCCLAGGPKMVTTVMLLALLSVLGGVNALGPIGILVGPMLVAFLQMLLNVLHRELTQFDLERRGSQRAESRKWKAGTRSSLSRLRPPASGLPPPASRLRPPASGLQAG